MATSTLISPSTYEFNVSFKPDSPTTRPEKRPKLSLNTSGTASKRSFGRNTTAIRLDTIVDASPTSRNTCQNSYGLATESPKTDTLRTRARKPLFPRVQTAGLTETTSAVIPVATIKSAANSTTTSREPSPTRPCPYKQPPNIRSILVKGPLSKRHRESPIPTSAPTSAPAPYNSGPLTPPSTILKPSALKRVCFRDPVEEEITNSQYLLRHSDLRSRSTSPAIASPGALPVGLQMTKATVPTSSNPAMVAMAKRTPTMPPPKAREAALKSRAADDIEEDDLEATAAGNAEVMTAAEANSTMTKTPIAGRHQKERDWKWTLGPLPKIAFEGSALFKTSSHESEEDLDDSLEESVAAAGGFYLSRKEEEIDSD